MWGQNRDTILHVDMDAFFASVEQVKDPALVGKPLVVGGSPDHRGVVCTASYEARRYGIHSGMSVAEAHRRCPHAVFITGSYKTYTETSDLVMTVLETVSPVVEPLSLDEAYVDVTGSYRLFGSPTDIADLIRHRIRSATSLPASVGISTNRLVSKVATDEAKPDGVLYVEPGQERSFLAPLDIRKLPGVGKKTAKLLRGMGIHTIGRLAEVNPEILVNMFGRNGYLLHRSACGLGSTSVNPEVRIPKSISRETTFARDKSDWSGIRLTLTYLAERTMYALRQRGMAARRVTLKVRFSDFEIISFARTLDEPTQLDTEVLSVLADLIETARTRRRARVRRIGVTLSELTGIGGQMMLFTSPTHDKWSKVFGAVDRLRGKYEFDILKTARSVGIKSLDRKGPAT